MRGEVRKLIERNPNVTVDEIVAKTGFSRSQAVDCLWAINNEKHVKACFRRWVAKNPEKRRLHNENYRRACGQRPQAEVRAEVALAAARNAAPVVKLKRKGASFSEVGQSLGLTRNAVAGRIWRAKQRALRANDDRTNA